MSLFSMPEGALAGDFARYRATRLLLGAIVATALSIWLFSDLGHLWGIFVHPYETRPQQLIIASFLFGTVVAVVPVAATVCWLLTLWFGVESVYRPRRSPSPRTDRVIVGLGVLAWFAPALGFLATAIGALVTGRVHFVRPARDYLLAEDPIAYGEGLGFLFIMSVIFAWAAWRYWQGKLFPSRARG